MDGSIKYPTPDPWSLLTKAENRYRLGLTGEALIAADEAIEVALKIHFDDVDTPLPSQRKEAMNALRAEGVKVSIDEVLRLSELRRREEKSTYDYNITPKKVEEAISTVEELLTQISEKQSHRSRKGKQVEAKSTNGTPNIIQPLERLPGSILQVEPEFVTKLLLARAILSTKKKRIPRPIGLAITVLAVVGCSLFALLGGSGIFNALTDGSLLSIFGLIFDFILLLIAYVFLKIAVVIRGETR